MNDDPKTRLKKAEKVRQYKTRGQVSLLDTPGAGPESGQQVAAGDLKPLSGECPPANSNSSWVCDPFEKKAYMVGGIRPSDESLMPTTDFYRLDIATMKWTNLTDSLDYRGVEFFSLENCQRKNKRIPELSSPGHTLFRLHSTSFLLLFSGYDANSEQVSSKLIVIDLRHLEWWYQPVEGGVPAGRIDPTMVAIGRELYIFGGHRRFGDGFGDPHNSYSIASLSDDNKVWSWKFRDVPYSKEIPQGTRLGRATPIFGDAKILLTTWRTTNDDCFNLTENDFFCFHIKGGKFQRVPIVEGGFPTNLDYYFTFPMPLAVSNPNSAGPSHVAPRPSKSSPDSSVIICGWMDWAGDTLAAEVWHLELNPIDRIRPLDVGPMVAKLESPTLDVASGFQAGLQNAVMIGERLFLLGSRPNLKGAQAPNSNHPVFNTYFEVPLRRLCGPNAWFVIFAARIFGESNI